ncbi:VCBS repeat-containing protein [Galbibacter sp. BG1]|uniref:VCBS repeat-containing protein n=1 Tax=Galbibacter sp. BG1 TaxID=1170699 RepID=UPI0015B82E64|nr:VCBS repeat-containing protein [Galbibacter sp. BG1]QLE02203.1 VCBS repeat-containing protein [Galbibacter sp. BG1]
MKLILPFFLSLIIFFSCDTEKKFEILDKDHTHIDFNNKITENEKFNPLNFIYIYNGAGIGTGDINNDGLPDLYFAGNNVPSKLYLNKGNLEFEDISKTAGIENDKWATGINFVDINADGYLDIYVCVADRNYTEQGENLLYINQGDNTFLEKAKEYGLNDAGYSTQAVFFDFDMDEDLDVYILTNGVENFSHNNTRPRKLNGNGISTDRLYENNGNGTFTDISKKAGITAEGYGLGVGILDVNKDGLPDIYCANDFITNDLLWVNNGDGTFTDKIRDYITQTSHNGMGIDIADYNNDGLLDIVEVDMLPESNLHNKTMTPAMNYNNQTLRFRFDYLPQYVRNSLQLQNKNTFFSEIGRFSNISKTDWSWAPLFADLDNNGYKDLFISNGYGRDITDLDYTVYSSAATNPFGTQEVREKKLYESMKALPPINLSNYFFKNNGDLTFIDVTEDWSEELESMSNGAIYADLDNDGDLDIVTNNLNGLAFVYKNNTREKDVETSNYLKIKLIGPKKNTFGIGTTIRVYSNGQAQLYEQYPVRGYLSSVDYNIHVGMGEAQKIDSLKVIWPDKRSQSFYNVAANKTIEITYSEANETYQPLKTLNNTILEKTNGKIDGLVHKENPFIDFNEQPLLLKMLSREGPGLAVGDLNNDGLDDICMTTAYKDSTFTWLQQTNGEFLRGELLSDSWNLEQQGVLILDVNGDSRNDIYITSGGAELPYEQPHFQDKLYIQQENGTFKEKALPPMLSSTATVNAADFDNDGDLDLFIGSRLKPASYPISGESFLLQNDNGNYKDVTKEWSKEISNIGMVTSALWTDFNNDNLMDLIIVGEWMYISMFKNEGDRFSSITAKTSLKNLTGFWNSIQGADFDHDGDIDYIVGNLGKNSALTASKEEPLSLIAKDFDKNGRIDPIMGYYIQGTSYPLPSRDALISQIAAMKGRFPSYKSYGEITFEDLFTDKEKEAAINLEVTELQTIYIENLGNESFKVKPLPLQAQMAPTYGISTLDLNKDSYPDLLLTGNRRDAETLSGYLDGSIGTTLINDKNGCFKVMDHTESGFVTPEDTRGIAKINTSSGIGLLVSNNDQPLSFYLLPSEAKTIQLNPLEVYAEVTLTNGSSFKTEFYYGSGYLSQDSRKWRIPENTKQLVIYDSKGSKRKIKITN